METSPSKPNDDVELVAALSPSQGCDVTTTPAGVSSADKMNEFFAQLEKVEVLIRTAFPANGAATGTACASAADELAEKLKKIEETIAQQSVTLAELRDRQLKAEENSTKATNERMAIFEAYVNDADKRVKQFLEKMNLSLERQEIRGEEIATFVKIVDSRSHEMNAAVKTALATTEKLEVQSRAFERKTVHLLNTVSIQQSKMNRLVNALSVRCDRMESEMNDSTTSSICVQKTAAEMNRTLSELRERTDDVYNTSYHIQHRNVAFEQQLIDVVEGVETQNAAAVDRLEEKVQRLENAFATAKMSFSTCLPQRTGGVASTSQTKVTVLRAPTTSAERPLVSEEVLSSSTVPMPVPNVALCRYGDYVVLGDSFAAALFSRSNFAPVVYIQKELDKLSTGSRIAVVVGFDQHQKSDFNVDAFVHAYRRLIDWLRCRKIYDIVVGKIPPVRTTIQKLTYWKTLGKVNAALHDLCVEHKITYVNFHRVVMDIDVGRPCNGADFYFDRAGKPRFKLRFDLYRSCGTTKPPKTFEFSAKALELMREKFDSIANTDGASRFWSGTVERSTATESAQQLVTIGGAWTVDEDGWWRNDGAWYFLLQINGLVLPAVRVTACSLNLMRVEVYHKLATQSTEFVHEELEPENVVLYDQSGSKVVQIIKTVVVPVIFRKTNGKNITMATKFRIVPEMNAPILMGSEMLGFFSFRSGQLSWDMEDALGTIQSLQVEESYDVSRKLDPEMLIFLEELCHCRF